MIFLKSDQPKAVAAWSAKAGAARPALAQLYPKGQRISSRSHLEPVYFPKILVAILGAMISEQSSVHFSQDLFLKTKLADY